jgi:hypothetical protein
MIVKYMLLNMTDKGHDFLLQLKLSGFIQAQRQHTPFGLGQICPFFMINLDNLSCEEKAL